MKNAIRILMFTAMFAFLGGNELKAQDKYEYASITYFTRLGQASLKVTTADGTRRTEMSTSEDAARAIVTKANEMANLGWEVYNNSEYNGNGELYSLTYFLRRKKTT